MSLRFETSPVFKGGDHDVLVRARARAGQELAVTTGQQAGLFTGPLFTVLKALTGAALARALNEKLSRPVKPVFWVAGDDHDFAEINHCTVINAEGRPERIVLRERPADAPMLPAYREMIGTDGAAALGRLESSLPPGDFRTETLDWLNRAYTPDRSMAEAYAVAMGELLKPYGVSIARGWDAALKRSAMPVLLQSLRDAKPLEAALQAHAESLVRSGREVPVEIGSGLTLVMIEAKLGRDRLRVTGPSQFAARRSQEAFSMADIERIARQEPERLSANVLLRPVIEAALFPTVAYVGGPGELAYLPETIPLFEPLGVSQQAFVPRVGGTFIEPKVDKVLQRYGLAPAELAQPSRELAARVARDDMPVGAADALGRLREGITGGYEALKASATSIDPTLERAVEATRNRALGGLTRIEKKLLSALRRRSDTALQRLDRARDAVFPAGLLQERVITIASVLSRHGRGALDLAFEAARSHATLLLEGARRPS